MKNTAFDCANSDITDPTGLATLTDLDTLVLSGNTDILCSDLDALEAALPNTTITRPATCNNGGNPQSQQVQNLHNAQGQRVVKTVNGDANTAIHFLYDQSGQVIAEIDATTGATLREYIYVNGQQIAIVDDTGTQEEETYFVHNDHLGTPQKITDQTQAIVWDATYKPFGEVEIATAEIENNIRFPGQYADDETGLHYNYFRDYDPGTGRYVESDPIGLKGGTNTFVYTDSMPISDVDVFGLIKWTGSITLTEVGPRLKMGRLRFAVTTKDAVMQLTSACSPSGRKVSAQFTVANLKIDGGVGIGAFMLLRGNLELEDNRVEPNVSSLTGPFSLNASSLAGTANGIVSSGRANGRLISGGGVSLGNISAQGNTRFPSPTAIEESSCCPE